MSLTVFLGACGGATATGGAQSPAAAEDTLSGRIHIEGSSTVAPMTQVAAQLFRADHASVDFRIGSGGTSTGFAALCDHAADVAGASRRIKEAENTECMLREAVFEEFVVANDALTVVVNRENHLGDLPHRGAAQCHLGAQVHREQLEDTAAGVAANVGGTGYFGNSYLDEHKDTIRAVDVDNGAGCVAPSVATAQDGSYAPLSRPLFLYPDAEQLRDRPEVKAFVEFYVEHHAEIAEAAGFVPLNTAQEEDLQDQLAILKAY